MNGRLLSFATMGMAGLFLMLAPGRADETGGGNLSPARIDMLDRRGYFSPAFKAAVHDLVDAQQALDKADAEDKQFNNDLPDLQKQVADAQAKVAALREELEKYQHPDEIDFAEMQNRVKAGASPQEEMTLAQAYVWAYPSSPHQSDAEQYLEEAQKAIADQQENAKETEATRVAARAALVQRAQAHDLSLNEWRGFLLNMSEEDLLKYLGPPDAQGSGYWIYSGDLTTDEITQRKVGLRINFNAGRVLGVTEFPASP